MLDRVRIWDTVIKNDEMVVQRFIHYELSNPDGTIATHGVIPSNEWKELRDKVIRSFPANVTVSMLTDYLAVLGELI